MADECRSEWLTNNALVRLAPRLVDSSARRRQAKKRLPASADVIAPLIEPPALQVGGFCVFVEAQKLSRASVWQRCWCRPWVKENAAEMPHQAARKYDARSRIL